MTTITNQEVRRELGWNLIEYEFDPVRLEVARQSFASFAACPLSATGTKLEQAKAEASGERDQKSTST